MDINSRVSKPARLHFGEETIGEETTPIPTRAIEIAFDIELAEIAPTPGSECYRPFNEVAWDAKRLFKGSYRAIRELALHNARIMAIGPDFKCFRIDIRRDKVVLVIGLFDNVFRGMQIWKSGSEFLISGDDAFEAPEWLLSRAELSMETLEKYEAAQRKKIYQLKTAGIMLEHSTCGGKFDIDECSNVKVWEESMGFRCPVCHINVLFTPKTNGS